jgi:hypothetical protein
MRDIFRKIDKVAGTDIGILVTGETGTGKELIAREVHRRSPRRNGPFIAINCGAIPENLLESELFGHAKGAFTGAVGARAGQFQAASGGTCSSTDRRMPVSCRSSSCARCRSTGHGWARTSPGGGHPGGGGHQQGSRRGPAVSARISTTASTWSPPLPPLRDREDAVTLAKWFLGRAVVSWEQG